ncbi:hypothetical protein AKJ41_03650, partial [candidate division MSBL1 archaeon SCGC-AAA259O05]
MTNSKIEWLRKRKGITTAAPEFKGHLLRPLHWTLLKSAEPYKGKPRENVSMEDLVDEAVSIFKEQMNTLDPDRDWREAELKGAKERAEFLKEDLALLWKKESAAAQGIGKDPTRKDWECHLCEERFPRSRDLANHLTDRRAHGLDPEWVDNYIRKARDVRDEERYEYYKSSIARPPRPESGSCPRLSSVPSLSVFSFCLWVG